LQDVRFFFHGESTFRFPTGILTHFLLESNRRFSTFFRGQIRRSGRENAATLSLKDWLAS
jgi:hypothetical protein